MCDKIHKEEKQFVLWQKSYSKSNSMDSQHMNDMYYPYGPPQRTHQENHHLNNHRQERQQQHVQPQRGRDVLSRVIENQMNPSRYDAPDVAVRYAPNILR